MSDEIYAEPFGQRGLRDVIRPLCLSLCGCVAAFALFMSIRSHLARDSVYRIERGQRTEIGSAMGRFFIYVGPVTWGNDTATDWTIRSTDLNGMPDRWQPSWRKTLGLEWGDDVFVARDGQVRSVWRFHLQWRTVGLLCGTPILFVALRQRFGASPAVARHP